MSTKTKIISLYARTPINRSSCAHTTVVLLTDLCYKLHTVCASSPVVLSPGLFDLTEYVGSK